VLRNLKISIRRNLNYTSSVERKSPEQSGLFSFPPGAP
jgi:hypothetical protein